jgi:hypothetical protein
MSEPLPERLSRFTPDPGALDRDALLFAAGRASARTGRLWMVLAGVLAVSQAATLVLLWPRQQQQAVTPAPQPAVVPAPGPAVPPESELSGTQLGALRRGLLGPGGEDLPPTPTVDALIGPGPSLRAFGVQGEGASY